MKFRLIEDRRETFKVRAMCGVPGVSLAGYCAWRGRPERHRKAVNRALLAGIRRARAAHRGRYGAHRHAACAPNGSSVSTASGHPCGAGFGCVPRTAVMTCRSRRICSNRPSWRLGLIRFGWPASPPCQPPKGGSIWSSHWISSPGRLLVGRCAITGAPSRPCPWP